MQRIIVTGGPWPERIGCAGVIAEPPTKHDRHFYPWATCPRHEVIVLLDDDPLVIGRQRPRGWTCVLGKKDIDRLVDEI